MLTIRNILHPTDFSKHSEFAFRLACALARDYGAQLTILHVAEIPMAVAGEGVLLVPPVDMQALRDRLHQLQPHGQKIQVERQLEEGDAASQILRVAEETKCDVIVLGTHGRTGFGRFLMGSVAEQVIRRAPCPVVTAKTPMPATSPAAETIPEAAVVAKA